MVKIRFECGQEDRWSEEFGPFEYVQATYGELNASPDGKTRLADFVSGWWVTPDGQQWSDYVLFST